MALQSGLTIFMLGVPVSSSFNMPYLSTSLGDFWGRRWNLPVNWMLRDTLYGPIVKKLDTWATRSVASQLKSGADAGEGVVKYVGGSSRKGKEGEVAQRMRGERESKRGWSEGISGNKGGLSKEMNRVVGVLACFFVSALAHEMLVYLGSGRITGEQSVFFLSHGVFVVVERWLHKRGFILMFPFNWILTMTVILVTAEWWFFAPFLHTGIADRLIEQFTTLPAHVQVVVGGQ
eukprot:comp13648_c1_seq1/m.9271 comp13648_c1_seq1/g.9271  ORF comp13648_c1_seq1/g.9271 comp13648_c1_seq1/m.9271 type:complete len:233 (-) comp13648_c1_seq1:49-747(-)